MASIEQQEFDEIAAQIAYHEAAYRAGNPEITDAAFDELFERYQELADALGVPLGERLDARPGDDHAVGFETAEHRVPMLSLEKLSPNRRDSKGEPMSIGDQLSAWYARRLKDLGTEGLPLLVEPKVDGISISLVYAKGKLVRAVTRGDGRRGDVITAQVKQVGAVPERLKGVTRGELELRGEVYWPRAAFNTYNERAERTGEKRLINPRNGCAGMMKRKNPEGLEEMGIRAFLYQVARAEGVSTPDTQSETLQWLAALGGDVYLDEVHRATDDADALAYCDGYLSRRAELDYDIDGMVIKIDELGHHALLEGTGHHPHWGIAYKFPPEQKPTLLHDVIVQVGKSGKLTPVAVLEPVFVAGTTVSRASLHNFVEIERKDVRVGDTVLVEKAGEIIPQVVSVVRDKRPQRTRKVKAPTHCPTCGTAALREEIFIYCPNPACPDQVRERLRHFASRQAMDIDGMGQVLVDQVVDKLGVRRPDELFSLKSEDLAGLERMGHKSAERVVAGLQAAKQRGLARVLLGLSIRHVGQTMADDLAAHFNSAEALLAFSKRYVAEDEDAIAEVAPAKSTERGAIEGLARKTADSIFAELDSDAMRAVFAGLAAAGVKLEQSRAQVQAVAGVAGKSFVLTGTLPNLTREEAGVLIKAAGGKVIGSVSKKTDYLVAGDKAGSKLDKAQKLQVAILSEADLRKLLKG